MLSRYEKVTPDMAREFVAVNANLCPLDERKVRRFARRMRWGLWKDSEDPVIINDLGYLTDGQHRLHACIESGKSIEVRLLRCQSDEESNRKTRLKYKGVNLSECIRILWILEKSGNYYDPDVPLGGHLALLGEQIADELHTSVDVIPFDDGLPRPEVAVAIHWALLGRGRQRADEFFRLLYDRGNPELDYLRWRIEASEEERYQVCCLIWGWNCWTDKISGFDYGDRLPRINNPAKKSYYKGE